MATADGTAKRIERADEDAGRAVPDTASVAVTVEDIRDDATRLSPRLAAEIGKWLDWQSRMIHGVRGGAVFLAPLPGAEALRLVALWPDPPGIAREALADIASRGLRTGRDVERTEAVDGDAAHDLTAHPLLVHGRVVGVVALALSARSNEQRRAVTQLQRWCAVWLERLLEPLATGRHEGGSLQSEILLALASELPLALVANTLCTLLAERLHCSRVALGFSRGLRVRLAGVSHQIAFDRRSAPLRALEHAMEECADRGETLASSTAEHDSPRTAAHARALAGQGDRAACSVPLALGGRVIGVLSCLRGRDEPFVESERAELEEIALTVAPILELRHRAERSPWRRLASALHALDARLPGEGRWRAAVAATALAAMLALVASLPVDRRIGAASVIEGALQRAVVVPFAGHLAAVHARAGDVVEAGEVLAELDDAELRLERDRLVGERARRDKAYQLALASRDRAEVAITAARLAESDAELALVERRLERARLRAPFAGLLVSGDWSRSLGAPLETGAVLHEIVPLEGFRVILEVDEHDVAHVAAGQRGTLRLAGLPFRPIALDVSRVLPVATARDGGNHFRVEAQVGDPPVTLRPGMRGVARVVVGRGALAEVWTRTLIDRLRLWIWAIAP